MLRDRVILLDIEHAARLVLDFLRDMDEAAFADDVKTQAAVLHELAVLGEAVKRLTAEFRAEHPEIAWKSMAGLRDRVIHGYDQIDLAIIWKVGREELPVLIEQLHPLLPTKDEFAEGTAE